jgi:mRNA interferase MazF
MTPLARGMVVELDLGPSPGADSAAVRPCVIITNAVYNERLPVIQVIPITEWNKQKARILTNVELYPSEEYGLDQKLIVDCLQTRPVEHRGRLVKIRGKLSARTLRRIDAALRIVFEL